MMMDIGSWGEEWMRITGDASRDGMGGGGGWMMRIEVEG